ncbi:MAG TPA: hypothetical protein VGH28_07975 [Polyangiaceae bacterium]|jgi:hypothetical protein
MRRGLLALFFLCACTQDFDKFEGEGGSADSASEAASDAPSCNVPQSCIASASTCGQS